jgi:predicted ATP-dependent serine protease
MGRPRKEQEIQEIESRADVQEPEEDVFDITSSGIDMWDLIGGGFLWGTMVNIVGDKSTGKTLLSSEFVFHLDKKYGSKLKRVYDDAEAGYSFDDRKLYGIQIVSDYSSNTIEDFQANVDRELNNLKDDERLLYILDTFDGLTSDAELGRWEDKIKARAKGKELEGSYGQAKPKGAHEFFRVLKRKIKK